MMDQIFEILTKNPILIIIILGILFKVFGPKKTDEAQSEQAARQTQQRPQPKTNTIERARTASEARSKTEYSKPKTTYLSVEEQRAEQLARLKQSYQTSQTKSDTNSSLEQKGLSDLIPQNKQVEHLAIENSLTEQGLINSVVMAEVLGAPRALQPYQNVVQRRR